MSEPNTIDTIDINVLESITGGMSWGEIHTIGNQALQAGGTCALAGALVAGPKGAILGGLGCGGTAAFTAYKALQEQKAQEAAAAAAARK
jgi:hypothetical protein